MITRFAPSLTGYLHLGHVLHMVYVWGLARKLGAKVLCRIEDHDLSRARPEYETAIIQTLEWLGFVPDLGMLSADNKPSEFRQSDNDEYYQMVLHKLENRGLVYGCECSRKQILASMDGGTMFSSSANSGDDRAIISDPVRPCSELVYSGTCANKGLPLEGNTVRFRILENETVFQDLELGKQGQLPWLQCGDFSLRDRQGQWTYQFACVCDDIRHGVDLVIRGEDILFSTARQIQLFQMLEESAPQYFHHPLILNEQGRKLSKRQRSESITQMRENGISADEVIGRAAFSGKLIPEFRPLTADEAIALMA